jgi:hypothetical protein
MATKSNWMMAIIAGPHAHHSRDGAGELGRVKGALPSVAAARPWPSLRAPAGWRYG